MTRRAFTLIELLVVVAIIVALLAILMPSMSRALFVSQVAVCASQFHQAALANIDYAADNVGAFPRHDITWRTVGRNSWDMHVATGKAFDVYGYSYRIWHCPVRSQPLPYATADDAINAMRAYGDNWIIFSQNYWVPRRDAAAWIPNGSVDGQAVPDSFPTRVSHPKLGTRPLISDATATHWTTADPTNPKNASGGHPWQGRFESTNGGYGDGHVETHYVGDVRYIFPHHVNWW